MMEKFTNEEVKALDRKSIMSILKNLEYDILYYDKIAKCLGENDKTSLDLLKIKEDLRSYCELSKDNTKRDCSVLCNGDTQSIKEVKCHRCGATEDKEFVDCYVKLLLRMFNLGTKPPSGVTVWDYLVSNKYCLACYLHSYESSFHISAYKVIEKIDINILRNIFENPMLLRDLKDLIFWFNDEGCDDTALHAKISKTVLCKA